MLLHLVDGTEEDVAASYRTVRGELVAYGHGLEDKNEIVALTKVDALTEAERVEKAQALGRAAGKVPFLVSAPTGEGVDQVVIALLKTIDQDVEAEAAALNTQPPEWRP